jgi:UDP-N-acetyl-D-mannosaminouronate:lipid I N-acetyl-D-mannosaminouronosyltransferase
MCHLNNIIIYPFKNDIELLDHIDNKKKILIALNALKITNADDTMREIINNNIGYADGVGVVLALKWKGCKHIAKIPGCELWLKIIEKYYKNKTFYFIGGKQDVIEETVEKLKLEYREINIAGFHHGYFDDMEKSAIIQNVIERKPDIVFVAMGSPKQELFMAELYTYYPALYQGLGGSFDIYTNRIKRAPQWLIKLNLEWAWRLVRQPGRIVSNFF